MIILTTRSGTGLLLARRGRGEMADALASGASGGNPVEVRLLSTAFFCQVKTYWLPLTGSDSFEL